MFPPLLVLIGACLVALGARWPALLVPGRGEITLFDLGPAVAWSACGAVLLAVPLAWLRLRAVALAAVVAAVIALGALLVPLRSMLEDLRKKDPEAPVPIEKVLRDVQFRSGLACVGGGILLQFLALMFRSSPATGKRY